MPTPVAQGEVVQVLVQGVLEGQEVENVWYFRAEAPDVDFLLNLLTVIGQCIVTSLIPALNSNYTLERIKGHVVSPGIGAEEVWTPAANQQSEGAIATDALPSYCSALISLYTTRGGRSGRGRVYIAGVSEADTQDSYLNIEAPLWAALLAFGACLLQNFHIKDIYAAGDYTWGVMSRKIGGVKPPFDPDGYAPITRAVPVRLLATTRSRKQGRGR